MKRLLLLAVGSFIVFSCNKSSLLKAKIYSPGLSGKWQYTQYYSSNGGPLIYQSTASLGQWIIFNGDSTFSSNMPDFEKFITYKVMDSARVKLISSGQQPDFRLYHYFLDSTDNSLSLSPADFICIEGCGYKFKR